MQSIMLLYTAECGVRSYPSRDKTARFLTADVEQLIRDGCAEKERLSVELREKLKKMSDADASTKKSSQVKLSLMLMIAVIMLLTQWWL